MAIMPMVGRARVLRSWGGIMDMTLDGSPIIDRTPVPGLYLNGGWCYGGFKATPASGWCFAHLLARDEPHPIAASYRLDRLPSGQMTDEKGADDQAKLQRGCPGGHILPDNGNTKCRARECTDV